nr:unnamed protein product [Spirometra erinaceieuropaei]
MAGLRIGLWVWTNGTPIPTLVDAAVGAQNRTKSGLSPLTEYNTALTFYNMNKNVNDTCNQTIKALTFPNAPIIKVSDVGGSWMRITFESTLKADSFNLINTAVATDAAGTKTSCSVSASILEISCDLESLRSETEYSIIARTCIGMHCSVDSPAITVKTLTEAPATVLAGQQTGVGNRSDEKKHIRTRGRRPNLRDLCRQLGLHRNPSIVASDDVHSNTKQERGLDHDFFQSDSGLVLHLPQSLPFPHLD